MCIYVITTIGLVVRNFNSQLPWLQKEHLDASNNQTRINTLKFHYINFNNTLSCQSETCYYVLHAKLHLGPKAPK